MIAHELFIEGRRTCARAPGVSGPEARGVGCDHFVDERQPSLGVEAELELGVGDDQSARTRVLGGEGVERERSVPDLRSQRVADQSLDLGEIDVLVMLARGRLAGGREQRLRQRRGELEPRGQRDAAYRTAASVILPA